MALDRLAKGLSPVECPSKVPGPMCIKVTVGTRQWTKNSGAHLLVIDDETAVLYTIRAILEHFGWRTSEAVTPEQALQELRAKEIDVVICDLNLGSGMSALDLLAEARRIKPGVGCIVLTGFAEVKDIEELEQRGIPVLYKPIEPTRLVSQIQRMLQRRAA